MALSSYWVSAKRKDLAERAIVKCRDREASRMKECEDVASFHRNLALKCSKYRALEEATFLRTPRANEESVVREKIIAEKKEKLEIRRRKLAHLLTIENDQYMKELQEKNDMEREKDPWSISRLKEQISELQRKRREGEESIQRRYMHHLFKCNGPCVKESEEERLQKEVSEAWEKRKEELEKLSMDHRHKEDQKQKMLELKKLKMAQEAREVQVQKLEEKEKWTKLVQLKFDELDGVKQETSRLKAEEEMLKEYLENIVSQREKWKQIHELQARGAAKISSLWQPKEKLRKMAVEIQHSLESDCKMLKFLLNMSVPTEGPPMTLPNFDGVRSAMDTIEMQISTERKRDLELQQLFDEEASKLWQQRKSEWNAESATREQLMKNVFESLISQLKENYETNIEKQRQLLNKEENCRKEITDVNEKEKQVQQELDEKEKLFEDHGKRLEVELESQLQKKLVINPDGLVIN